MAAQEEAAQLVAAAGDAEELEELVRRREAGEPPAWLVGAVEFCGLRLRVHPGVYVPRRQTEALAERAASLLPPAGVAVDLCTGAGPVAAVLRARRPAATVVATDIDAGAVACARTNGVEALHGDLDSALPPSLVGAVDLMTAVVPYVPTEELRFLPRDVLAFEPRRALDGGPGGTAVLSEVVRRATRWLRRGGWLLLELGGGQAATVAAEMEAACFECITVLPDEEGDDRGVEGRRMP
ncbi:MAG TPA: HemK/PrmC family methyltransferase [Acidimicrobiales bacterium]|nr:HemK/PrmC family methyltransferase [Acidimicrobiales bacterium]